MQHDSQITKEPVDMPKPKKGLFGYIKPATISAQVDIIEEPLPLEDDLNPVITNLGPEPAWVHRLSRLPFSRSQHWLAYGNAGAIVLSLIVTLLLIAPYAQLPFLKTPLVYSASNLGSLVRPAWVREPHICATDSSKETDCQAQHLAFVDSHNHLYLWDAHSKLLTRAITFQQDATNQQQEAAPILSWLFPGRYIAMSTAQQENVWDVVSNNTVWTFSSMRDIEISPDGNWAAVATDPYTIQIFALNISGPTPTQGTVASSFAMPAALIQTLSSPEFAHLVSFSWSPDSDQLATLFSNGALQTWESRATHLLQTLHVFSPSFLLTGIIMVWASNEQSLAIVTFGKSGIQPLQIWDLQSGRLRASYTQHTDAPFDMFWVDGGKELLSLGENEILLWNALTGQILLREKIGSANQFFQYDTVEALFSQNQRFLLLPTATGIQIVDINSGRIFPAIQVNGNLLAAKLSSDGRYIASINTMGLVQVWNVERREMTMTYNLPENFKLGGAEVDAGLSPVDLAWSPQGELLAVTYIGGGGGLVVLDAN